MKPVLSSARLQSAARILKCIAHADRLRLVQELESGKRSVQDLETALGLRQAVVSKHLAILRKAGVVQREARSNFRYYHLLNKNVSAVLDCMRRHP